MYLDNDTDACPTQVRTGTGFGGVVWNKDKVKVARARRVRTMSILIASPQVLGSRDAVARWYRAEVLVMFLTSPLPPHDAGHNLSSRADG